MNKNYHLQFSYTYKIFNTVDELPYEWEILAKQNILFSFAYLKSLQQSKPKNVTCFFVGLYQNETLSGIALAQLINLNLLESFGERDKCIKTFFRNLVFRNFCSNVLVLGNNFFTGQNAFVFAQNANVMPLLSALKNAENVCEYLKSILLDLRISLASKYFQ